MLVMPGTPQAVALARAVRELFADPQPGPLDFRAMLPIGAVWVRRVPGAALWIYFDIGTDELTLYSLNNREPIRMD